MVGETGPISVSLPVAMTIAAFFGISCYNVLEINISIFMTFKRRRGLYFWSMVVASWGIIVHAVAVFLRFFDLAPDFPMAIQTVIGWFAMVTGQAVVLYSRLHLVVNDKRRIRWVLIMIITNFFILHVPVTALFLGSNYQDDRLVTPFNIYERIQLVGFSIQESLISALYIRESIHALKPILAMRGPQERKIIIYMIIVNIMVVVLDATLCVTEFTNHFDIQTTYKTVVYSVKLKMEFYLLNWLLEVLQRGKCNYPCNGSCLRNTYNPSNPPQTDPSTSNFNPQLRGENRKESTAGVGNSQRSNSFTSKQLDSWLPLGSVDGDRGSSAGEGSASGAPSTAKVGGPNGILREVRTSVVSVRSASALTTV